MSGHERQSVFRSEIFPSIGIFVGLTVAMLLLDGLLHWLDLVWIGRYLGIPGTILILVALQYSLNKHKIVVSGDPRTLLRRHELLAWIGALLVLVHAGVHFNTILPWLALAAMLINVASGLTGKYLLNRSRQHAASRKAALLAAGETAESVDKAIFLDAVAIDMMKKWRDVHIPIFLAFAALALAHIISVLLFWSWR